MGGVRIEIPQWVIDLLYSLNVWRGQWLSWELWLFGAHIFTFTIPPFNFIPGIYVFYALDWLKNAVNDILSVIVPRLDDLSSWRDFLWGEITGWISDRLNNLQWWRDWLIDRAWEAISDIANLWNEVAAFWSNLGTVIDAWWTGTWKWVSAWIIARANDAINTVWGWLLALRTWWDKYNESLFQFLFNPWLFLWNAIVKPLLDNDAATISPLQPVLAWFNTTSKDIDFIIRNPDLWVFQHLEKFITYHQEQVRRAITTFIWRIWFGPYP